MARAVLASLLVLGLGGCLRTRFDRCLERTVDCRFLDGGPETDGGVGDAPPTDAPTSGDAPVADAETDAPAAADAP